MSEANDRARQLVESYVGWLREQPLAELVERTELHALLQEARADDAFYARFEPRFQHLWQKGEERLRAETRPLKQILSPGAQERILEGIERFAPHMSDVVVGHVLEREQHPDADKLGVCRVDVGGEEPLQIVCGAPNVAGGQRVAVATIGTVLPGDFKIKKSKIRGVESRGMICSVHELDLGDEHDGIWVLPEGGDGPLAVGQPVAEALGLGGATRS